MRFAVACAGVVFAVVVASRPAEAKMPPMTISGGDLPYAVTAVWPDTNAFWEAKVPPTVIHEPPPSLGQGYQVVSWYWDRPLGSVNAPVQADETATYYPFCAWWPRPCDRGVVRVTRGGAEYWLLLGEEQDLILRLYVTLARERLVPPEPTVLQVLAARMVHGRGGEHIDVAMNGARLRQKEYRQFWQEMLSTGEETIHPFPFPLAAVDVTFTLSEGRGVSLRYLPWSGYFVDMTTVGDVSAVDLPVQGMTSTPRLRAILDQLIATAGPRTPGSSVSQTERSALMPMWAIATAAAAGAIVAGAIAAGAGATLRRRRASSRE